MERLDVPRAPIARLLKTALPESYKISREVKEACARAAGLYLLYMANAADECCRAAGRTTVSAEDVLGGMEEVELDALLQPTHDFVRAYRKKQRKEGGEEPAIKPTRSDGGGKKSHSKKKRSSSSSTGGGGGSSSRGHKKSGSSSGGSDRKRVRTDVDLTVDHGEQRQEGGGDRGEHGAAV